MNAHITTGNMILVVESFVFYILVSYDKFKMCKFFERASVNMQTYCSIKLCLKGIEENKEENK